MFDGLPKNHFKTILADPPWRFQTYSEAGRNRNPDWKEGDGTPRHYETMSIEDIMALPVLEYAADDCVLFMWMCWPNLLDAIQTIEAWGFTYKTLGFDWVKAEQWDYRQMELIEELPPIPPKDDLGMGYWTRSNPEACLLATRGKPKRKKADVRALILDPRREHSRKPDCIHDRIERLVDGPYLELFGRRSRPGWEVRGDQATKFDVAVE